MDNESFPAPVYAPQSTFSGQKVTKDDTNIDAFITKAEQHAKYEEDMWTLQLDEVYVTAPRIEKKDETRLQFWANESSDVTITRETIEKTPRRYVSEYLTSVAGVRIDGNGIAIIRGVNSFRGPVPPLLLVDGMPRDWPDINDISVSEVESIDVFIGPSASVFGARGASGVVSISLKKGSDFTQNALLLQVEKPNQLVYSPSGYQKPAAFYSPKYETLKARQSNIPDYRTTIFWKPDVVIADDGKASFEFYTSDFRTTYSVVIEGLTSDGSIIRQVEKIRVE
jgi:hypothetical protein